MSATTYELKGAIYIHMYFYVHTHISHRASSYKSHNLVDNKETILLPLHVRTPQQSALILNTRT